MSRIDTDKEILNFIINNKNTNKPVRIGLAVNEDTVCNFCLINDGEYIETTANEVPNSRGEWHYNNGCTFDYEYCNVDNKLLSIEFIRDVDFGNSKGIVLRLFPNVEDYNIKTVEGHRNIPYLQLVNDKGEMASAYPYELPREDLSEFDGLKLIDLINPLTLEELIERYNSRYNKSLNR